MPYCQNKDICLHYELKGTGPPILMLNHSGTSMKGWRDEFLEKLSKNRTLVMADHRGTGCSDDSDVEYRIIDLANNSKIILDHAGIDTVDVLGLSMGGTIAQEFAFSYPNRIRYLILLATFCGQRKSPPSETWVMPLFQPQPNLSIREQIQRMLPIYYSKPAITKNETELITLTERGIKDTLPATLARQGSALRTFDSYDQLAQLQCRTLIIHGKADALIPYASAQILADRIPDSKLILLEGVAHVIPSERPVEVAEHIQEFLK